MSEDTTTSGPADTQAPALGGWVLRVDQSVLDVSEMLDQFGQVYRYPIPRSADADRMAPGQPCFLFQANRSKVIGIWAVGEVVAEPLALPVRYQRHPAAGTTPDTDASGDDEDEREQLFAEVELLPLEKPLAIDKLLAHKVLANSPLTDLAGAPDGSANPIPLKPAHVRAIETFDFWIAEPTDEQRAALDALLVAEESSGS